MRAMAAARRRISPLWFCSLAYLALEAANIAVHFPYATDRQVDVDRDKAAADFYQQAYAAPTAATKEEQEQEEIYVAMAKRTAETYDIEGQVKRFVADRGLRDKRVLEVGAGRGYLQDLVDNYVGLDISPTARRYFHKPFVQASATAMPFRDNEFDGAWTIWTLEHVPNPESALREIRRVVKPGGVILLMPAWFCTTWAADGYKVRPYSDFGIAGKITKASLLIRGSATFSLSYALPIRALRLLASEVTPGPTTFHYTRLTPNYKKYWVPDGDAVNSLDPYEAVLWFESRGDRCLNCSGRRADLTAPTAPVIRVGSKN
jgi:SAM-dependent methyltransferase